MTPPVKNLNFLKYPYGDCTQWFYENPALYASMGLKGHNGIDIVRPWGDHLYAVEDGTICAVKDTNDGYGKHVRLLSNHVDGVMRDWVYGHMSYIHVKNGQKVRAGDYIGNIGNTGFVVSNSTGNGYWEHNPYAGTHLHLGVRDVKHDADGFLYAGYDRKIRALNYDNGYKGRYDPLPLFATPQALKWATFADKIGKKIYWQLAQVLHAIKV